MTSIAIATEDAVDAIITIAVCSASDDNQDLAGDLKKLNLCTLDVERTRVDIPPIAL